MASLDKVLKYVVVDDESKQTVAAFLTPGAACLYADEFEDRYDRKVKVIKTTK